MKDRLIALLRETFDYTKGTCIDFDEAVEINADHLIANGVIVPPVKVGQTVWCILNRAKPQKFQIKIVSMTENFYSFVIEAHKGVYKHYCDQNSVGRVVFFTEEEAKKALAERSKNDR